MMNKVLFSEKQRFKIWMYWIILLFVNGISIYEFIRQIIHGQPVGNNPASNLVVWIITIGFLILTFASLILHLEIEIRNDGIYYRLFPLNFRWKKIVKEDILEVYIREYNALGDYTGWGIRWGDSRKDKAIIFGGNQGIQIVFKTEKKLLLGTRKPEEAKNALKEIGFFIPEE